MRQIVLYGYLLPLCLIASIFSTDITPDNTPDTFQSLKILDQKEIIIKSISGILFAEASDLAYDAKRQRLYMISDEGFLYTFEAILKSNIEKLTPLVAVKISKKNGKEFKKRGRDSEGLTLDNHGELLISFEGKPKIGAFGCNGQRIKKYRLPKKLKSHKSYRSTNKALEAIAYHPKYGILTSAELPLKGDKQKHQTIYSLSGKEWHFLSETNKNSSVTAIEIMDDGNVLILERAYTAPLEARIITLKKVYLDKIKNGLCHTKIIAKMNSNKGWKLDNFEGLTKVAPHRYLMISDDNGNFFQKTLLIYFEVIE